MWFERPSYRWECIVEGGVKETELGDVWSGLIRLRMGTSAGPFLRWQ